MGDKEKVEVSFPFLVTDEKSIRNRVILSEVMDDDLIIFPSSIHEFIFMKSEVALQADYIVLKGMVENVN